MGCDYYLSISYWFTNAQGQTSYKTISRTGYYLSDSYEDDPRYLQADDLYEYLHQIHSSREIQFKKDGVWLIKNESKKARLIEELPVGWTDETTPNISQSVGIEMRN